jgi:general secretion pathway protein B
MSFILDALKKSESDRARQTGPALYEVRVPPPRHGLPLWALAVVALLAVNLLIGAWMLLHRGTPERGAEATSATAPASPALAAPAVPAPATAPASPAPSAPTQALSTQPPAAESGGAPVARNSPPPAAPAAESGNPEDYVPAGPAAQAAAGAQSHVQRGTVEGVPLYQDVATSQGGSLPQLRLDLHVYAPQPAQRFVMINMRKLREGDTTPDGVHVDSITPDGAVLSYNGSKFLLTRD